MVASVFACLFVRMLTDCGNNLSWTYANPLLNSLFGCPPTKMETDIAFKHEQPKLDQKLDPTMQPSKRKLEYPFQPLSCEIAHETWTLPNNLLQLKTHAKINDKWDPARWKPPFSRMSTPEPTCYSLLPGGQLKHRRTNILDPSSWALPS